MAGTIVYVDLEPDLPDGLGLALARLGFRLRHTSDLDEVLARVREGAAHLVLLEPLLDGGRGWQLVQQIRELAGAPGEVPIVILTRAQPGPRLDARARQLGTDQVLTRPVRRRDVLAAVLELGDTGPVAGSRFTRGRVASGVLAEARLPELLLELRETRASGLLFLQDLEDLVVQIENGSPIGLVSSRGDETFADFLIRTKRISADEHSALLERAHETGESESEAASSTHAMTRADVQAALVDRSAEPLVEAFTWAAGSWRFERDGRLESGQALDRGVVRILVRGVLEWTPSSYIRAMLDQRGALHLSRVECPPYAFEDLSPAPCAPEILACRTRDRTLAEALEAGEIGERELYALLVAGFLEASEQTPLELQDVVQPTPAPAMRRPAQARVPVTKSAPAPVPVSEEEEKEDLLELEEMCEPLLDAGLLPAAKPGSRPSTPGGGARQGAGARPVGQRSLARSRRRPAKPGLLKRLRVRIESRIGRWLGR